jgi:PIN domain nuclease of toxin-antitoxin system
MKVLLDTHALLWWLWGDPRLSRAARRAIETADAEVYVSAASALEIATKVRIGKLPEAKRLAGTFSAALTEQGFRQLPITVAHALRAGVLAGAHRDPFDRLLAAQSMLEDLPIVSGDAWLKTFGVSAIW